MLLHQLNHQFVLYSCRKCFPVDDISSLSPCSLAKAGRWLHANENFLQQPNQIEKLPAKTRQWLRLIEPLLITQLSQLHRQTFQEKTDKKRCIFSYSFQLSFCHVLLPIKLFWRELLKFSHFRGTIIGW